MTTHVLLVLVEDLHLWTAVGGLSLGCTRRADYSDHYFIRRLISSELESDIQLGTIAIWLHIEKLKIDKTFIIVRHMKDIALGEPKGRFDLTRPVTQIIDPNAIVQDEEELG
jgi:hypothetical protein